MHVLCERIAVERDLHTFSALVDELNALLERKEQRLGSDSSFNTSTQRLVMTTSEPDGVLLRHPPSQEE